MERPVQYIYYNISAGYIVYLFTDCRFNIQVFNLFSDLIQGDWGVQHSEYSPLHLYPGPENMRLNSARFFSMNLT